MNEIRTFLLATVIAIGASAPVSMAFADGAISNDTTTSMGVPYSSPGYAAPRSAIVPGLPLQERQSQQMNRTHDAQLEADESSVAPRGATLLAD